MFNTTQAFYAIYHLRCTKRARAIRSLADTTQRPPIVLLLFLAYLRYVVDIFFSIPRVVPITIFTTITIIASIVQWTPFDSKVYQTFFFTNSNKEQATQLIKYAQNNGDPLLAEKIFVQVLPFISEKQQKQLRALVYPQEKLEVRKRFFEILYAQQPTAREALIALAIISYQEYDETRYQYFLELLKTIEPNDQRIPLFP